jgi:hypothetical protein
MHGICDDTPKANHVCTVYTAAAILLLQFIATCNYISNVKHFVLLYQFPQYVCSTQYGCFLQFFNFVLFRYVAGIFSE